MPGELLVDGRDLREERVGERAASGARQVPDDLRKARHDRGCLRKTPAAERTAEEKRSDEAVARDVPVEPENVPRLLAAEESALAPQRLEHVAVTDVGRDDANAVLLHQAVEAEVRHYRHRDRLDAKREREDRDDLVAVDRRARLVDSEHPVAVSVERDAEIELSACNRLLQSREVRGAA